MRWGELERAAPALAQAGRQRLDAHRVALIATLRRDGSPRISAVVPYFAGGRLVFGAMRWSRKTADLERDARCALHSPITDADTDGEFKLYGRAEALNEAAEQELRVGWWREHPAADVRIFELAIDRAVLLEWDLVHGELLTRRWSPRSGLQESRRAYP